MTPKIVFLDASTVDQGDIDFSPLMQLGEFISYPLTAEDSVIERCINASVIITNKVVISEEIISKMPKLKMIAEAATGYNNIDIAAAKEQNIAVANVPGYSTSSVAQLTMSFILALSSNLINYNAASHDGRWSASPIFTLGNWPFSDLEGKTVGILGYGAIGKEVARLCSCFGMKTAALQREGQQRNGNILRLPLYDLAAQSDFVSIHLPLTDYSNRLIDEAFLSRMKKSAYLINLARGPIVDPAALCTALEKGTIAGAALDVMDREPPAADDPLLRAPNLIITPHIGWASVDSRRRLVREIAENISSFLSGEKRNTI